MDDISLTCFNCMFFKMTMNWKVTPASRVQRRTTLKLKFMWAHIKRDNCVINLAEFTFQSNTSPALLDLCGFVVFCGLLITINNSSALRQQRTCSYN